MQITFPRINLYNKPLNRVNTYPNLAPLKHDTVSFSARAELNPSSMSDAPHMRDCGSVYHNSEPARFYLQSILEKYIEPLNNNVNNGDIIKFSTRSKSPQSIKEKVISKFDKIKKKDAQNFCTSLVNELTRYFPLDEKSNKESIVNNLLKKYDNPDMNTPFFENAEYFYKDMLQYLSEKKLFNFSTKTPEQNKVISQKIIKKLYSQATHENTDKSNAYIPTQTISGIKHYANDIVGGRITLLKSDTKHAQLVLKKLKEAVDDGYIKILSVENNIPDSRMLPKGKKVYDYSYVPEAVLKNFAKDTNSKLKTNTSKTGYMGVHVNVALTTPILDNTNVFSGYTAEIQILGKDVELLKDVEDLCYKIKDNKNALKDGAYKDFKEHFQRYYTKFVKKHFDEYTYKLYLAQRELGDNVDSDSFPTVKDLGFRGNVPPALDFNELRKLKINCEMEAEKNSKKSKETNIIRNDENIDRVKNTIKNELKK